MSRRKKSQLPDSSSDSPGARNPSPARRSSESPRLLLDRLVAGGRGDRLVHVHEIPDRTARFGEWPSWADEDLVAGWSNLGVARPWAHQLAAAEALHEQRHTVIATSTGSGKSAAYWLPAISAIRAGAPPGGRARPTALYLSPTKALGVDQLTAVRALLCASEISDVQVASCDGDTSFEERKWVQAFADIVATNPDLLHFSLLPQHHRWTRFLRGLQMVIVDESHSYRGVFGAHVAAVLRRLRRICAYYGAFPVFALASATTSDPAHSAARLIGVSPSEVEAIVDDASPQGKRVIALWEPPLIPTQRHQAPAVTRLTSELALKPETDPWQNTPAAPAGLAAAEPATPPDANLETLAMVRRSAVSETADLLTDLCAAGAQTLAFVRSRRSSETVASITRRNLADISAGLASQVASYRGGYLPEERRELEDALRSGRLRALATTNALELGIDISGLDAVLICGWPGTQASLWQQAGRAGRAGREGLAVLVARDDPLDTYLVHHPESIFGSPVEASVFDPENPYVLGPHLCAAAAELPLTPKDSGLFGPSMVGLADVLAARGGLRKRASGWYWTSAKRAASLTDLRGSGGPAVRVVEHGTGRMLGTVDAASAPAQLHPGALYLHQGASFLVRSLNLEEAIALVEPRTPDYTTYSSTHSSVEIIQERAQASWGGVAWHFGVVEVSSQVVSYQRRSVADSVVLATIPLDMPAQTMQTTSVWWTVTPEVLARAEVDEAALPGCLHAAEHASIGLLPLLASCDRWDIGGLSTANHPDTELPTVFVHDGLPGGAGFAQRGFELGRAWLTATAEAIASCRCATGCPSCVQSPKCGNNNHPLEKAAALRLLRAMLDDSNGFPGNYQGVEVTSGHGAGGSKIGDVSLKADPRPSGWHPSP